MKARCLFLLLSLVLIMRLNAQTSTEFAMRQFGYFIGNQKYKVKNTGEEGKFPIGYMSFEGIYFTGEYFWTANANYLFLNGDNARKTNDAGIEGVDISLLEFSCGRQFGPAGFGITGNIGWHGPSLPNINGAFEDNGYFMGFGGQFALVVPVGDVYRSMNLLTSEALFTRNGDKPVDGFSVRFDSQFQYVPFRWLAVGVRPTVEYRKFKTGNSEKIDLRTFTTTLQVCVGINFWKHAQSY